MEIPLSYKDILDGIPQVIIEEYMDYRKGLPAIVNLKNTSLQHPSQATIGGGSP